MTSIMPLAQADILTNYNVTETFFEPETQPNNTIFTGSFTFDSTTNTVSNLTGWLTESMTHIADGQAMTSVPLMYQLSAVSDGMGGLLVTAFKNSNTNTFYNPGSTDNWSPQVGVDSGGIYYGFPKAANNPGNAYAMIDINLTDPTAALTQAQIDKLAYADCTPTAAGGMNFGGGMMGAVCMTGTSLAGYGSVGTMAGYPVSETITAAVPEPSTYALMLAGLGLVGFIATRRRKQDDLMASFA